MKEKLSGISETLLIPLWARAVETQRQDGIVKDPRAVEILQRIDYDFSKFEHTWMSQLGVSVRTEILDRAVRVFIEKNPEALIINLGAGLDTRFTRLDDGKVHWIDLDLPQVIALRRNFFEETKRYHMIAESILDFRWLKNINHYGRSVLLIAEGLLLYLEENEVQSIFQEIPSHFPVGEMLCELLGPALVGKTRLHDTVSTIKDAQFKWSIKDSRQFERWNDKIRYVEDWYYTDFHRDRWRWFGKVTRVRFLRNLLANRIVRLRFVE